VSKVYRDPRSAVKERPLLDKVERDVTMLFLDIEHDTKIPEDTAPETLHRLIEQYFSTFLKNVRDAMPVYQFG